MRAWLCNVSLNAPMLVMTVGYGTSFAHAQTTDIGRLSSPVHCDMQKSDAQSCSIYLSLAGNGMLYIGCISNFGHKTKNILILEDVKVIF